MNEFILPLILMINTHPSFASLFLLPTPLSIITSLFPCYLPFPPSLYLFIPMSSSHPPTPSLPSSYLHSILPYFPPCLSNRMKRAMFFTLPRPLTMRAWSHKLVKSPGTTTLYQQVVTNSNH